jgi:hypothetical protein
VPSCSFRQENSFPGARDNIVFSNTRRSIPAYLPLSRASSSASLKFSAV